jgi:ribonuclease P/MRP protein subunit RPP1
VVKRAVLPTINDNVPRLLSRLTITLDEADQNYSINASSDVLTPFDVVAVRPLTEKAFQTACATLEMDVITLDMSTRLPFYLKHTTLHLAMSRGIFFEITYASALHGEYAHR